MFCDTENCQLHLLRNFLDSQRHQQKHSIVKLLHGVVELISLNTPNLIRTKTQIRQSKIYICDTCCGDALLLELHRLAAGRMQK